MAVSRTGKRGTRAGHMIPESRNKRVRRNAGMKAQTKTFVPGPEPVWRPIRLGPRREEPDAPLAGSGPLYETEMVPIVNILGVKEFEEVTINRRPTVIDGWLHDDETFFERRHIRVIDHARGLWRDVSFHAAAPMRGSFDTRGLEVASGDEEAARAMNLLRRARTLVPRWQWNMFENVVRWNEPYGFPGSHLFGDKPRRRDWAMLVVRGTAETISKSLFL